MADEPNARLRLLVPVDAGEHSRWGVTYAVRKREIGTDVAVLLLHVAEPLLRSWDILRFYTEQEVASMRRDHAQYLLEDAAQPLKRNDIAHCLHFREGDIVFEILDAAEQLDCHQIVVAAPGRGWRRLLSRRVVPRLLYEQRNVPVVTVNKHGVRQPP